MSRLKAGVLAEPVLVGREKELEELQQALDQVIKGRGKTVFVAGEAGSGKTRLADDFLNKAKQQKVAVLSGWCISEAAVPYFPFVEAFDAYFSPSTEEEPVSSLQLGAPAVATKSGSFEIEGFGITAWLSGLRPAENPKFGMLSPQVWKDQLFAAVARALRSIAAQSPTVLFIEDIHWADSASLALLHYISRVITSEKILVLATFRSEELTADAEGRPHPLAETMRQMRREDLFAEINLPNLDKAEVAKTVENMLGGKVQSELVERLAKESRGNSLFVVESLRMLCERKSLVLENGEWRLGVEEVGIPSKVRDIILRRVGSLKRDQRRVLDAASVIGEKFDVELLGSVLSLDSLMVLETLNDVAQSTSLVRCEEDYFRFDHSKSREALYEEIPLALKKGYHARIAEKLEAAGKGGRLPLGDLAYHYTQAGQTDKTIKYGLAAGQDALEKFSNAEAIKHFTLIIETVGEDPNRFEERISALEGLGDAFYAISMFKESMRIFEKLGNTAKTDIARLRAVRKAMESAFQLGDATRLIELMEKADPYAAADRLESARVLFSRGRASSLQSKYALKDYQAALQVFEEEYSLWDTAWALIGVGANCSLEAPHEGIAKFLRSITLFEELRDFRWQMEAYYVAGFTLTYVLLLEHEALEMFGKVMEIDEKMKMGDYLRLVYANAFASRSLMNSGDFEKALVYGLKALELSSKTDSLVALSVVYSVLAMQYALLGDVEHAEEYFEKFMKLPPEALSHVYITVGGSFSLVKGVFYAGKGQWKESDEGFKKVFANELEARPGTRLLYAWALERQGRSDEAKVQFRESQRIRQEAEKRFEHFVLRANLMARRQIVSGEEIEIRLDLVNTSRKPGVLKRIEKLVPEGFEALRIPAYCTLNSGTIKINEETINPFQVRTITLSLKALKTGIYTLNPTVVYVDEFGEVKTCKPNSITVNVQPPKPSYEVLHGRITTGSEELDALLFGGIPEHYAVALTSFSTDERDLLIKKFLEAGAKAAETTFHITTDPSNTKDLAENYPSSFYLIVCNPTTDAMIHSAPNVSKLKGVENLTDIDIALTKAFRTLNPSAKGPKRICVEIVSDALLQHHAVNTRRWLSALLPTLKSKGFTILAVVDPQMHPPEELQSVVGVFDGEIRVTEKETPEGIRQVLRVRKLLNQKYLENEIVLSKEKLS